MTLFLFDALEFTHEQLVTVIREQLAPVDFHSMADCLRSAVMYCPSTMTTGQFAKAAVECGIHAGTARCRYNEVRRWQRELGEIG